jgi:hypothetical protein
MNYARNQRSANEIRQSLPILSLIDDEIQKLLTEIYTKIDNAYRINEVETMITLPIHFNHLSCKFISDLDLRKKIYYQIITKLEEKSYKVGLNINNDLVILKVSWPININDDEIKKMDDKFKSLQF